MKKAEAKAKAKKEAKAEENGQETLDVRLADVRRMMHGCMDWCLATQSI